MSEPILTAEEWAELVRIGNTTWRRTLDARTAAAWYQRLCHLEHDVVSMALEDLSRTESSWPDLAKIVDAAKPHRHRERYEDDSTGTVRLCDWLDAGAPGYPDGEQKARDAWAAMDKLGRLEANRPRLQLVPTFEPDADPLDEPFDDAIDEEVA